MDRGIEILTLLLGGGAVAIIGVISKAISQWREGRTAREDTTIKKWQEIAAEHEHSADKAWAIVAAYRKWYAKLWASYVAATQDMDGFPADPTERVSEKSER